MLATVGEDISMDVGRQTVLGTTTRLPALSTSETQNLLCRDVQRSSVWFIALQKVEYGVLRLCRSGCELGDNCMQRNVWEVCQW
jgi:hypothetical protein